MSFNLQCFYHFVGRQAFEPAEPNQLGGGILTNLLWTCA